VVPFFSNPAFHSLNLFSDTTNTGFGKEVCEISGRHGVVQELKGTLAYPHVDFGNSYCTVVHHFTALFALLTSIRVAVQQGHFWHWRRLPALHRLLGSESAPLSTERKPQLSQRPIVLT
jgi:hypothetical protein